MNIDDSLLRPGYQTEQKEGFYAEFDAAGQLTHFGYYENGKPQGWALYLSPEQQQGHAKYLRAFSLEAERTRGDGWDDDHESVSSDADLYRYWVESQIEAIYDSRDRSNSGLCCSFCGKYQNEVEKLIAGPQVFICNECISLCNDILDEEAQPTVTSEPTM